MLLYLVTFFIFCFIIIVILFVEMCIHFDRKKNLNRSFRRIKAGVAKLKARVERLKARVKRLKAQVEAIKPRVK